MVMSFSCIEVCLRAIAWVWNVLQSPEVLKAYCAIGWQWSRQRLLWESYVTECTQRSYCYLCSFLFSLPSQPPKVSSFALTHDQLPSHNLKQQDQLEPLILTQPFFFKRWLSWVFILSIKSLLIQQGKGRWTLSLWKLKALGVWS